MSMYGSDVLFLRSALVLARRAMYQAPPNPAVGCLLVKAGQIIGRGWTQKPGSNHAEVEALQDAKSSNMDARGATAFVSLEPCCFKGRTPACTDALISAGIQRVVCAWMDPNPKVSGKGFRILQEAGIHTDVIALDEDTELNRGFIQRMQKQLPWVRIKSAISLDARTAMASGESQWITSAAARADVQHWRARSCAIITGVGTIIADKPRLTVRATRLDMEESGTDQVGTELRQPLRIVLDSRLRSSPEDAVYNQAGASMLVTCAGVNPDRLQKFEEAKNIRVLVQNSSSVNLPELLESLGKMEINEVLVEAGAKLVGAFFEQALWDEAIVYVAPRLMGRSALPLADITLDKMRETLNFRFKDVTHFESDIRIRVLRETHTV